MELSQLIIDGPADADHTLVLAHGAGAPMDAPFMNIIAEGVAAHGIRVARFEFPYMAQRRVDGKKRPPNGKGVLFETWRQVIRLLGAGLVIGGKSMGGRIASMVADEMGVAGLICLGYPFHPPGKPEKTRTDHLRDLATPTLILQGTRDPFGTPDEVPAYQLAETIRVQWLEDGDHSLKPRVKSGRTEAQNLAETVNAMVRFIQE